MIALIAPLMLIAHVACTPTEITEAEAKALVLKAGAAQAYKQVKLDAELAGQGRISKSPVWAFRVFGTGSCQTKRPCSNLVGWFSVNKMTAVIVDQGAGFNGEVVNFPGLEQEQTRLRKIHCSN